MPGVTLQPEQLNRRCDPSQLEFETTTELEPLDGTIGQDRASQALQFGIGMRHQGYNLFVLGSSGMGRHALARRQIEHQAKARRTSTSSRRRFARSCTNCRYGRSAPRKKSRI